MPSIFYLFCNKMMRKDNTLLELMIDLQVITNPQWSTLFRKKNFFHTSAFADVNGEKLASVSTTADIDITHICGIPATDYSSVAFNHNVGDIAHSNTWTYLYSKRPAMGWQSNKSLIIINQQPFKIGIPL